MSHMTQAPRLFDRKFISLQHGRRSPLSPDHRFLFEHAERDALERLEFLKEKPQRVAIHGRRPRDPFGSADRFKFSDDEELVFIGDRQHERYDLILSLFSLHAINDVPRALASMRDHLDDKGVILACAFGERTLATLRQSLAMAESEIRGAASVRVYPFAPASSWAGQMQSAGLALPVADAEPLTVHYRSLRALLQDLRMMGEANGMTQRGRLPLTQAVIERAEEIYKTLDPTDDGLLPVTFDIAWMMGFKN